MNCRRVFFVENEEGWGAGVNGDRRRKLENAKFVSKSLNHGEEGEEKGSNIDVSNYK